MSKLKLYTFIMILAWAIFYLNGKGDASTIISPIFLWIAWMIDNARLKPKLREKDKEDL